MSVELSVTCWERTYREVLAPGFFAGIAKAQGEPFTEHVAVINNVVNVEDAIERAQALVAAGEISRYTLVADRLAETLRQVGLSRRKLGPVAYYTDHFLVAVTQPGPRYLCHWDADAKLEEPCDWVTPTAAYLDAHPEVLVGMPGWRDKWSMDAERLHADGDFDIGYGFSDHVFLVERARLAEPVYRYFAPASWWYQTNHLAPIFEQRVDAYMRRKRLLRATYRAATYFHDEEMVEQPGGTVRQRALRKARSLAVAELERHWPRFNPTFVRRPGMRDR